MNNIKAIIYKKERNPMQTGIKGDTEEWILEYPQYDNRAQLEFLNFIGSAETNSELHIKFNSKKEAILYAKSNNICFEIIPSNPKIKVKPKNYANNFSYKLVKYY